MARPATPTRRPPSGGTTRRPAVDEQEPTTGKPKDEAGNGSTEGGDDSTAKVARNTQVADGSGDPSLNNTTDATDEDVQERAERAEAKVGKDARKVSKSMSEPDVSAGGGDGATGTPATGTCRDLADKLSTKEGDAPIGVERDAGAFAATQNPAGPDTHSAAALTSLAPAGTLLAGKQSADVAEEVFGVLRGFAKDGDDAKITGASNIHDDLGIQRAHIVHVGAKLEEAFGIDITPSEAQNILLARDAVNLVLRKLSKQS